MNGQEQEDKKEKRRRDVAHLWCDKQVLRFFRKGFDKRAYRKYRDVYLALCEIDSDFNEGKIYNLTKTCGTYTGMDQGNISKILQEFRKNGLIDYGRRKNDQGQIIGSFLVMYKWEDTIYHENLIRLDPIKARPHNNKNPKGEPYKNSSSEEGFSYSSKEQEEYVVASDAANHTQKILFKRDKKKVVSFLMKAKQKAKPIPKKKQAKTAVALIDHWNALRLRRHLDPKKKIYSEAVRRIKYLKQGKLYDGQEDFKEYWGRRFTDEEIRASMDNFALAALDPVYEPSPAVKDRLRMTGLPDFFLSPFAKEKSYFLKYLRGKPKPVPWMAAPKDEHPGLTKALKRVYTDNVLGGLKPEKWPLADERSFRLASNRVWDFFSRNRELVSPVVLSGNGTKEANMARLLFDAISADVGDAGIGKLSPGWFGSEATIARRLPSYLYSQGIINQPMR